MVIADFFHLDEAKYAQRISQYDTERLIKQEVVKLRQQYSASWTLGTALGGFASTHGASLVVAGYGARRNYVAKKKMALIQAELNKRNVTLHKRSKRDVLIPLVSGLLGAGIGFGVDEVASHTTNTAADGMLVPSGSSSISAMLRNIGDALHGAHSGMSEQLKEVMLAVSGLQNGVIPGSHLSQQILSASTTWITTPNATEALGFHAGMLCAQRVENSVIVASCAQSAWSIMEAFESRRKIIYGTACKRSIGSGTVICNECSQGCAGHHYWHCCQCSDDFDLCAACYDSGKRCLSDSHAMKCLQNLVESRYVTQTKQPRYQPMKAQPGHTVTRNQMGNASGFLCNNCKTSVHQGLWYYCEKCPQYDLCQMCYLAGNGCFNKNHTLMVQMCAFDCSDNPEVVKDCKVSLPARLTCDSCNSAIVQGRYYHCCNCADDSYNICESCCWSGVTCSNPSQHMLQARYFGKKRPSFTFPDTCWRKHWNARALINQGRCDRCKGKFTSGYVYHCCQCNKDNFDLCTTCYGKGKGCDNPKHTMTVHHHG